MRRMNGVANAAVVVTIVDWFEIVDSVKWHAVISHKVKSLRFFFLHYIFIWLFFLLRLFGKFRLSFWSLLNLFNHFCVLLLLWFLLLFISAPMCRRWSARNQPNDERFSLRLNETWLDRSGYMGVSTRIKIAIVFFFFYVFDLVFFKWIFFFEYCFLSFFAPFYFIWVAKNP